MKAIIPGIFVLAMTFICAQSSFAQQPPRETIKTATNNTPEQMEVISLSKKKMGLDGGQECRFFENSVR